MTRHTGPVVVTGTDTGVGKTVVTAAVAAAATAAGLRVTVVKPAQTGGDNDAATVTDLAGCSARTLVSYPDPLAPLAAARVAGLPPLRLTDAVTGVSTALDGHDLVLVEGAGGVLVGMGEDGWTVADLAVALGAPALVVARAGLGTLNHTALTLEALDRRGVPAAVVIGAWPIRPDLVHHSNLTDLPGTLLGAVPEGAGDLDPTEFRRRAPGWLATDLHGHLAPGSIREMSGVKL